MKIFTYIFISLSLTVLSCGKMHQEKTVLDSSNYDDQQERIEKLRTAVTLYSEILDTEFKLFNVNGFNNNRNTVPGASSWNYRFCVKMDTSYIHQWLTDMTEVPTGKNDTSLIADIVKDRQQNWLTHSKPKYYSNGANTVSMTVFEEEGIIFKTIINL
jgi:hypothetical protein